MISKGIILAAGRGTRLYPATMVVGKPLLPIFDKPMIYYSLTLLMKAQIRQVCIVTNRHDVPLFRELLGDGHHLGMHIQYRIQDVPKGIADVFHVAKDFIDKKPCVLMLGDNIFIGNQWENRLMDLQNTFTKGACIFACPVHDPNRYGVLSFDAKNNIEDVIEKPKIAPSNLAITGLYFYDEQATDLASTLKPSARGELEITDLNRLYLKQKNLMWMPLDSPDDLWFDVGTHEAMYLAIDKVSHLIIEKKIQIGCIEEQAFLNGWIEKPQLALLQKNLQTTNYGQYLRQYL